MAMRRTPIRRLDPAVVDQIAAGEVVERPASAIKELLENSIDAGADRLEVRVRGGGLDEIVVRDNGDGIPGAELALAVERHATSKLRTLDDLYQDPRLGFRGEALAAIGAASRLSISSRHADAAIGARVVVEYGERLTRTSEPVPLAPGTEVRVEGLFAKMPGRLKHMGSASREYGALLHVVQRYAIGYPSIAFHLVNGDDLDGSPALETSGAGDAREVIQSIYGVNIADRLVHVTDRYGTVLVEGWIAPPDHHRGNRQGQALYINGRPVHNVALRMAAERAFRPRVPDRHFPAFWLWMDVPADTIDPNAHPAKWEIRCVDERQLAAYLYRSVAKALGGPETVPSLLPPQEVPSDPEPQQWIWPAAPRVQEAVPTAPDAYPASEPTRHADLAAAIPLAQWQAKYIIAQAGRRLIFIDQHAAHERIYFEHFRERWGEAHESQPLLLPWSTTLAPELWTVWEEHRQSLQGLGFDVETLGGRTVAVRALPFGLLDDQGPGIFVRFLEAIERGRYAEGHPLGDLGNGVLAMAACKAAVKAYRGLSLQEMEHLIQEMAGAENPYACPHGRPTVLDISLEEVDRRFGRHP